VQRSSGEARAPLVKSERRLLESARAMPPALPPERRPAFAAVGLALGAALGLLARAATRRRAFRIALGAAATLLGTGLGVLGCVFAGFWLLTKHWAAHQNLSLLLCPPWALALCVLGVRVALGKPRALHQLEHGLWVLVTTSAVALLIALVPGGPGEGGRLSLLVLPIWLGPLLGVRSRPLA
jgi:hypothetical protein